MPDMESQRFRRALFRVVVLLPALMAALAAVLLVQIDSLLSVMSWVDRSSGVISQAHRVRELLVNMEFGIRGFASTGEGEFVDRYREAADVFESSLQDLKATFDEASPPEQREAFDRLVSVYGPWTERSEKLIAAGDAASPAGLYEYEALLEAMKAAIVSIVDSERADRAQRIRERREAARVAVGVALLLTALLGLGLWGVARRQLLALSGRYEQALADVNSHAEAMRKSEELFRAMIEHAWEGVVLMDAAGKLLYVSRSTTRILGHDLEELLGRNSLDLIHPDDLPRAALAFGRTLEASDTPATTSFRLQRKDGSWRWMEATAVNLLDNPRVRAVVANFRDVTERKDAEDQRNDLLRREKAARSEAEAANRAKDEFLATLSHELRSPLNSVLTATHILRSPNAEPANAQRALEVIERSVRLQTRLIEDLLDVSRIVSGKLAIEIVEVDLRAIVEEATEVARAGAEAKGIRFHAELDGASVPLRGDSTRLLQAIGNLLSNAIKFT
ncbi:MAG: PAS domain S-box protein, partial [Candidatus Binatia bacterium]